MGKIHKAIRRADSFEEHVHRLPNGELTGGPLHKPSKDQFDMHTHLYEHNEDTLETEPMHDFGDHTHKTIDDETSGPQKPQKKPGKPFVKMDSLQREGCDFVLRSSTGHAIGRGRTVEQALAHYDSSDREELLARFYGCTGEE